MRRVIQCLLLVAISVLLLNCPSAPPPAPSQVAEPTLTPAAGTYTSAQSVTIQTATAEAEIRYTLDGSDPIATTGTVYTGPVAVSATTSVKAIAVRSGWTDSPVASALYTITGTVAAPTFEPSAGTYTTPQSVTLRTTAADAEIYYTVDGSTPSKAGTRYTGPISVDKDTRLQAIAVKQSWADSPAASAAYTITGTVAAPIFWPEGGTYSSAQSVALTVATPSAEIRYTTDGSDPSATSGTVYSALIPVERDSTLKAIAVSNGWDNSPVVTAAYTITGRVATPAVTPPEGKYTTTQIVSLASLTPGAEIRYTTDGSVPSATNGRVYTDPIPVTSNTEIRAVAIKQGWLDSETAIAQYTIERAEPVAPVTDAEVASARAALAAAREWGADYYDPETMKKAREDFDMALMVRTVDPEQARIRLASAQRLAEEARARSMDLYGQDMSRRMAAALENLRAMKADLYVPADFERARVMVADADALIAAKEAEQGKAKAYEALKAIADLRTSLDNRIRWVKILRRDTEYAMADSEKIEAVRWLPDQKREANTLYLEGVEAFQAYNLDLAQERLEKALAAARKLFADASLLKTKAGGDTKAESDDLLLKVMTDIEDASKLTVVTEEGTLIEPEEWNGEENLRQLEKAPGQSRIEDSDLLASVAIPLDGSTVVLAAEGSEDLLTQAKELWKQGIDARNAGDYAKSLQLFSEASRAIEAYKQQAVKGVYTVRLIPQRRDALWHIAEYDFIYNYPRLWPLIWMRNWEFIPDPDVIEPEMQLVIPLEDRSKLAVANYLAGRAYQASGKVSWGQDFVDLAFKLDPTLDPSKAVLEHQPTAAELLASSSTKYLVAPQPQADLTESVRSFFLRFSGALAKGAAGTAVEFFDGSTYLTDQGVEATRGQIYAALDAYFAASGSEEVTFYTLSSIMVAPAQAPESWGATYTLDVDSPVDLSSALPFWSAHQRFWIRRDVDAWLISAMGTNQAPATWTPQPASASPVEVIMPTVSATPVEDEVQASFVMFADAFAKKDLNGTLAQVAETLELQRIGASLTAAEQQTSFMEYFGAVSASAQGVADLFDVDSLYVESSASFTESLGKPVYRVSVHTSVDLSAGVPFWSEYQDYYFASEGNAWKIFAIF